MNIYIFADIEGISGVYAREQVTLDGNRFQEGRAFMTADINACAAGCKAGGADKVIVRDGHGGSYSVKWNELSTDIDALVAGTSPGDRFPGFEDIDGLILLGYHGMAGTQGAILEHTFNSKSVQNYWINGNKVGETGIDAGIAGEQGVPVIMVSGDDKVCKEAKDLMPWVETAQVKEGMTSFGGILLGPEKAHQLIFETAKRAVENIKKMQLLKYEAPVTVRLEKMERIQLPNPHNHPWMKVIDGRTFEVTGDTLEDAFYRTY